MTGEDLDALTTEELRHRAFEKARAARDIGFFWDLVKHLRSSQTIALEDGSSGALTGSITEAVEIVRELMGKDPFDDEALLRARFTDYLSS